MFSWCLFKDEKLELDVISNLVFVLVIKLNSTWNNSFINIIMLRLQFKAIIHVMLMFF